MVVYQIVPGYTENEKLNIAQDYLVPRQVYEHGLRKKEIKFKKPFIQVSLLENTQTQICVYLVVLISQGGNRRQIVKNVKLKYGIFTNKAKSLQHKLLHKPKLLKKVVNSPLKRGSGDFYP